MLKSGLPHIKTETRQPQKSHIHVVRNRIQALKLLFVPTAFVKHFLRVNFLLLVDKGSSLAWKNVSKGVQTMQSGLGFVFFHLLIDQLINEKIIWLLAQSDTVTYQYIEFSL